MGILEGYCCLKLKNCCIWKEANLQNSGKSTTKIDLRNLKKNTLLYMINWKVLSCLCKSMQVWQISLGLWCTRWSNWMGFACRSIRRWLNWTGFVCRSIRRWSKLTGLVCRSIRRWSNWSIGSLTNWNYWTYDCKT